MYLELRNAHFGKQRKNEFSETQTEAQLRPRSERERVEENLFFRCWRLYFVIQSYVVK